MVAAMLAGVSVLLLAMIAEWLHARRVRRVAHLAFGPAGQPRAWVWLAPLARAGGLALMAWGMTALYLMDPKFHRPPISSPLSATYCATRSIFMRRSKIGE